MKKYNIEGGIDFYSELYKSLDVEENEHKTEEDAKLCLITNQPLTEKHFEMVCGHKFNYLPLYFDLKNHKQKFNGMESTASHLKHNEIRCPYCRKKQTGILPYYEELGLPKINGVNDINVNIINVNTSSSYKPCQFLELNPKFDENGNNIVEVDECNNGNCKFFKCFHLGSQINYSFIKGQYKNGNYIIDYPMTTINDDKYYCWSHKTQMIKKYKRDILNKAKDEVKKLQQQITILREINDLIIEKITKLEVFERNREKIVIPKEKVQEMKDAGTWEDPEKRFPVLKDFIKAKWQADEKKQRRSAYGKKYYQKKKAQQADQKQKQLL